MLPPVEYSGTAQLLKLKPGIQVHCDCIVIINMLITPIYLDPGKRQSETMTECISVCFRADAICAST